MKARVPKETGGGPRYKAPRRIRHEYHGFTALPMRDLKEAVVKAAT